MIVGRIDTDFETLRQSFFCKSILKYFNEEKFKKKFSGKIKEINKMPVEQLIRILEQKINKIENGEVANEDELEKLESEISIILSVIPMNIDEADRYWKKRQDEIKENENKDNKNNVLIEIAAQHPLVEGKPGREFAKRLEEGMELYYKEKEKGNEVLIYIPGSLHSIKKEDKWETDSQSLSLAGKEYLIERGIPEEIIKSDETNALYKEDGVYNSADECYVASCIARDNDCGRIISVVSPAQIYRKALLYNEFGYNPEIHSVALKETFHNYIGEIFWSLYITYAKDHSWQEGFLKEKTRQERNNQYVITSKIQEILDEGIFIPDSIKEFKQLWLEKLNEAKENTAKKSDCSRLIINVEYIDDENNISEKLSDILKEEGKGADIYVKTSEQLEKVLNALKTNKAEMNYDINFHILEDKEELYDKFKDGDFSSIYDICTSSKSMINAINYIKNGINPIILSVPSDKDDYREAIKELYSEEMLVKSNENAKDEQR